MKENVTLVLDTAEVLTLVSGVCFVEGMPKVKELLSNLLNHEVSELSTPEALKIAQKHVLEIYPELNKFVYNIPKLNGKAEALRFVANVEKTIGAEFNVPVISEAKLSKIENYLENVINLKPKELLTLISKNTDFTNPITASIILSKILGYEVRQSRMQKSLKIAQKYVLELYPEFAECAHIKYINPITLEAANPVLKDEKREFEVPVISKEKLTRIEHALAEEEKEEEFLKNAAKRKEKQSRMDSGLFTSAELMSIVTKKPYADYEDVVMALSSLTEVPIHMDKELLPKAFTAAREEIKKEHPDFYERASRKNENIENGIKNEPDIKILTPKELDCYYRNEARYLLASYNQLMKLQLCEDEKMPFISAFKVTQALGPEHAKSSDEEFMPL